MAQFTSIDDAAEQLGVSKDRLNDLREAGKLRAYRDGSSWKFRNEDIERFASEGLPPEDSGLEIGDYSENEGIGAESDLELSAASDLELDDVGESAAPVKPESAAADDEPELELAASQSGMDDSSALDVEPLDDGDDAESILLSEAELGDTGDRPPSTIIGRNELLDEDLDLDMGSSGGASAMSDVRLADDDVLSSEASAPSSPPPSGKFEDLEELDIDLEAESSRILTDEDVAAAKSAAASAASDSEAAAKSGNVTTDSDLALAESDSAAGLTGLSGVSDQSGKQSDAGLTGISSLELESDQSSVGGLSGLSSVELADDEDDDFVLGDSGSDITLSSADSGINLKPSDSGLALDDAPMSLGGSAIGSALDLGDIGGSQAQQRQDADLAGEDFQLTPIGEGGEEEDEEDSSQIIALDAIEEDEGADPLLGGDLGASEATAGGFAAAPTTSSAEAQFPTWVFVTLTCCVVLMSLCGLVVIDMTQSIWSWNETFAVNSTIIDALTGS